ncbi:unnamed protein product, partial [Discosporangium mesarthrocarpum]
MKAVEVPPYYCMPDKKGAMATPPWSNPSHLLGEMESNGYRITANEWDAFPKSHLSLPGAVFGTIFRHPMDRWYSQYRFEHLEHRDGTSKNSKPIPFIRFYESRASRFLGNNYYVKTFCGWENPSDDVLLQVRN